MPTYSRNFTNRPLVIAVIAGSGLIAIGLAVGLGLGLRSSGTEDSASDADYLSAVGEYTYASVNTDAEVCSHIGTEIMARQRGNAFDAAVAAMFCVGLVNAQSCGIGGGSFIVYYDKREGEWHTINSRETAPAAADRDMYAEDINLSINGGLASGIPGEVQGLWMLHDKMGSLPWADLVQPSIDLCYDGIPLASDLYRAADAKLITDELKESFKEYYDEDGNLKPVGTLIEKPEFAHILERIRDDPFTFYNGTLAQEIVDDLKDAGGIITLEDLENYEAKWNDTVTFTLPDGHVIHSIDAPGSGPVLFYILNILAGYKMDPSHIASTEDEILTYHRIVEAFKFAFGKRTTLGDPDFVDVAQIVANMSDLEFGEATRVLIDDLKTHDVDYYYPDGSVVENSGTAHMSVVDGEGNIVAMTSTINHYFGSTLKGERTGIIFNNEMNDFSVPGTVNEFGVPASEANFIEPGKRPMSSMCPSVVWDSNTDSPKLITGAAGGTLITTTTAMNIIDILWLGRDLPESVDHLRFHHQLEPNAVQLEEGFPENIAQGLREKGHETIPLDLISILQPILVLEDRLVAVADYRKAGAPDGF